MNKLYVVSTYYHALIACVRHFSDGGEAEIMVTDYIPQHRELANRIKESGVFTQVHCVESVEEYHPSCWLDYALNNNHRNKKLIEKQMGFSLKCYSNIYIFHDDTWMAHYLKCAGIRYHLLEDGLDSYKHITETTFAYMVHNDNLKMRLKNIFRLGYTFCGYDRFTVSVEVNSITGVKIKHLAKNKLKERPRQPMFENLSQEQIDILRAVFLKELPEFNAEKSVLLLTQPLFVDGMASTEEQQLDIYKAIDKKHRGNLELAIKPHPRDNSDYTTLFPDAVILNKNMPLEIVAIIEKPHFAKIVSINSSCTMALSADEYIQEKLEDTVPEFTAENK